MLKLAVLCLLIGAALASPIQPWERRVGSSPSMQCRRSCLLSETAKFQYSGGKTYHYKYETESWVDLHSVEGQKTELKWSADVDLHFESPCEVTMQLKNPRIIGGNASPQFVEQLTMYPLRAIMSDGTFQDVCVDQQDDTEAINIKKGILSSLQNNLPSNSTINNDMEIKETDVVGECPTIYKVRHSSQKVIVKKMKEHHLCSKRFSLSSEVSASALPLKTSLPLKQSRSNCTQEIEQGIVKSVVCNDISEVAIMVPSVKTVHAHQKSVLRYVQEQPKRESQQLQRLRKTNLLFDFTRPEKQIRESMPKIDAAMSKICTFVTDENKMEEAAQLYSNLIKTMDRIDETTLIQVVQKIKRGSYCSAQKEKVLGLFLDAVTNTENNGAVKIMVDEIQKEERVLQYTWRLHTFPRVCHHAVQAVKPLFVNESLPVPVTLAAGSIVAKYCQTNHTCMEQPIVKEIMDISMRKIDSKCGSTRSDRNARKVVLAQLKALTNVQNITNEMKLKTLDCFLQPSASINVKLAAAELLKVSRCNRTVTEKLIEESFKEDKDEEVRIYAYKAAVQCASHQQLERIINTTYYMENEHVKSYILSDLTNLQLSKAPYKAEVQKRLANLYIPQDYKQLPAKTSRSYEYSMFTESGSQGFELDMDAIFTRASDMPRQLRLNYTLDIFKEIINVAELGIRVENLPALLRSAVKPDSPVGKTSIGKMIRNMLPTHVENEEKQLEMFVKLFGQEMMYTSFSDFEKPEEDLALALYNKLGKVLVAMTRRMRVQNYRGFQSKFDIHVPTIQGIPLIISQDISVVAKINAQPSIQGLQSTVEVSPIVSMTMDHFVGFGKHAPKVGLKSENKLFSASKLTARAKISLPSTVEIKIELPERQDTEIFKLTNKAYMMVKIPGQQQQVKQVSHRDPRLASSSCTRTVAGLQLCYEYDLPQVLLNSDYPLVKPSHIKCVLKKQSASHSGYELKLNKKSNSAGYVLDMSMPGTSKQMKLEVDYESRQMNEQSLTIKSDSSTTLRAVKIVHKKNSISQQSHDLEVYIEKPQQSSPQKVFSGSYSLSSSEDFKLKLKTQGPIESALKMDVDVEAPLPIQPITVPQYLKKLAQRVRMNKMEMKIMTRECDTESFIRKVSQSGSSKTFLSKLEHQCQHQEKKIVQLTSMIQQGQEYKQEHNLEVEWSAEKYMTKLDISSTEEQAYLIMEFKKNNEKKMKLVLSDVRKNNEIKDTFQIEIIPIDINLRAVYDLKPISADSNQLELYLMGKRDELFSVRGEISHELNYEESIFKQNSRLGLKLYPISQVFHLNSEFEVSPERWYVAAILNEEQRLVFDGKFDYKRTRDDQVIIVQKIKLPEIIDSQLEVELSEQKLECRCEVKLEVISPRHIEGYLSIQSPMSPRSVLSAKILWDKARNPEKCMEITGVYIEDASRYHRKLEGVITWERKRYNYFITSVFRNGRQEIDIEKRLQIHISDESHQEIFNFKSDQVFVSNQDNRAKISSIFDLTTPYRNTYRLEKVFEISENGDTIELKYQTLLHSSLLGDLRLQLQASSHSYRILEFESDLLVTEPDSRQPVIDLKFKTKTHVTDENELRDLQADAIAQVSDKKFEVRLFEKPAEKEAELLVLKDGRQVLLGKLSRKEQNKLVAEVQVLSKSVELSAERIPSGLYFTYLPEKSNRNQKFGAKMTQLQIDSGSKYSMDVEYPQNGIQKTIAGSIDVQSQQSAFEIDIKSDASTLLKIVVLKNKMNQNVFRFESKLETSNVRDGPKVIVDLETDRNNLVVNAQYKKDSMSEPTIHVDLKYVKQSTNEGVIGLLLKTPQKKLEVSGVMQRLNNYGCQGYKLNTTAISDESRPQQYTEIVVCTPGFVKVIQGSEHSPVRYVSKLGLRSYRHVEMSLVKNEEVPSNKWWKYLSGKETQQKEIPVVVLSAKLQSPYTMAYRADVHRHEIQPAMEKLGQTLSVVKTSLKNTMSHMVSIVKEDLKQKYPQLEEVYRKMMETLEHLKNEPTMKKLFENIDYFSKGVLSILEDFAQMFLNSIDITIEAYESLIALLHPYYEAVWDRIDKIIEDILDYLKNKLNLQSLEPEYVFDQIVEKLKSCDFWRKLGEYLSELCEMYSSQCAAFRPYVEQYKEQLRTDIKRSAKLLLEDRSVRYVLSSVRRSVDMVYRKDYGQILQRSVLSLTKQNVGLLMKPRGVELYLPVRQAASSIKNALPQLGFNNEPRYIWALLKRDREFRNFVRSKVTLPVTRCEYVFINTTDGGLVTIENIGNRNYKLKYQYEDATVDVKMLEDDEYLNGRSLPRGNFHKTVIRNKLMIQRIAYTFRVSMDNFYAITNHGKEQLLQVFYPDNLEVQHGLAWARIPTGLSHREMISWMAQFKRDSSCRELVG